MNDNDFPSNSILEDAIIKALIEFSGVAQVKPMNKKVIELLHLSKEIVEMEDENGVDTKLNYRLRWCRTNLKTKGKIENIKKGTWTLKKVQ